MYFKRWPISAWEAIINSASCFAQPNNVCNMRHHTAFIVQDFVNHWTITSTEASKPHLANCLRWSIFIISLKKVSCSRFLYIAVESHHLAQMLFIWFIFQHFGESQRKSIVVTGERCRQEISWTSMSSNIQMLNLAWNEWQLTSGQLMWQSQMSLNQCCINNLLSAVLLYLLQNAIGRESSKIKSDWIVCHIFLSL